MNNQNGADFTGIITAILVVFGAAILLLGRYTVVLASAFSIDTTGDMYSRPYGWEFLYSSESVIRYAASASPKPSAMGSSPRFEMRSTSFTGFIARTKRRRSPKYQAGRRYFLPG